MWVRKRSGGVAHVDDHLVVELERVRVEVGEQPLEGGGRRLAHADGLGSGLGLGLGFGSGLGLGLQMIRVRVRVRVRADPNPNLTTAPGCASRHCEANMLLK